MYLRSLFTLFAVVGLATAAESDAISISAAIQARHAPFGTIVDPFLDAQGNVTGYTRCGDSAIWTGHYLAAESFRYGVTGDPAALQNARNALGGIQMLVDVTGEDLLARCAFPQDSPFAAGILHEEQHHGSFEGTCLGRPCYWIANTSRDQYIGVFFGLTAAYQHIGDAAFRNAATQTATRLLDKLLRDNWAVRMPDGRISTSFIGRADQRLSLLAAGARINSGRFNASYRNARFWESAFVGVPILGEVIDPHNSYFKFNLDVLSFYQLATFETGSLYRDRYTDAYGLLRRTIDDHGNAHFNMIDRAIRGADARRDGETRELLERWLQRPRRDARIDLRQSYPSCFEEDRACDPIAVEQRVNTDFLWQRSPFLLYGGGNGDIENSGIDYILPYWMARFYGVI
ncbi:MAG: hypothetical protein SFV51_10255 [Bryobacteraceae bacterium]|nr:hypothetical protein [Bryobacteraceae bacterium]